MLLFTTNSYDSGKSSSKKSKKSFMIACLVVAGYLVFLAAVCVFTNWRYARMETPEMGVYYCEELDAKLEFRDGEMSLLYVNGEITCEFLAGYDNAFHKASPAYDGRFNAFYVWDQEKDTIVLKIKEFPAEFNTRQKYVFTKQSEELPIY